jgi:hypothetical protein
VADLCLTVLCRPEIEEKLFDFLLLSPVVDRFSSLAAAAHGHGVDEMDQAEQVLGRARATMVQVLMRDESKAALLDALRSEFGGTRLRYWITPVAEAGELR